MEEIKFSNKENIVNGFNIHDSLITNFCYEYSERTIYLELDNSAWGYDIKIKFSNVLYFEVQSCFFWGKGYSILEWELVDEKEIFKYLYQNKNYVKNESSKLTLAENNYFATKFLLNSGDEILICCEKIFVEEKANN